MCIIIASRIPSYRLAQVLRDYPELRRIGRRDALARAFAAFI